jgi:hypothetical protein
LHVGDVVGGELRKPTLLPGFGFLGDRIVSEHWNRGGEDCDHQMKGMHEAPHTEPKQQVNHPILDVLSATVEESDEQYQFG